MADRHDHPDDSKAPRHDRNSVAEETSATGQRFKGAIKEGVGDAIDDKAMEEKGRRENQAGIDRQKKNDAV
jgi:uncharacterized protein YjbJ (UPF0337 family)